MQFIITNYYHRHQNAIIAIRMLSSSSECYHRHQKNAIIVIRKMLSSSSEKCYHRHQNAIIVIKMLSSPSKCYRFLQALLSSSMEVMSSFQTLLSSSMEVMSSRSQKYQYRFHNSEITVFTIVISSSTKFFVWFA